MLLEPTMTDSQDCRHVISDVFKQYYDTQSDDELQPPHHLERSWGYDTFTGTTHRDEPVMNVLHALINEPVRDVFVSSGRYERPAAASTDDKNLIGGDLTFEIHGRELPGVTSETALNDIHDRAHEELRTLLALLEDDLGFAVDNVVFTGGDRYRVVVRTGYVQGYSFSQDERETILKYLSGRVDPESVIACDPIHTAERGFGHGEDRRAIVSTDGWGERTIARCEALTTRIQAGGVDAVKAELLSQTNLRPKVVSDAITTIDARPDEFRNGIIDMSESVYRVGVSLIEQELATSSATLAPEATTNLHRYIRVPGSLNGDTGLLVYRFDPDDVNDFDPWRDAVPDWRAVPDVPDTLTVRFTSDVPPSPISIADYTVRAEPGVRTTLPLAPAVSVVCRGWARVVDEKR